MSKCTAPGCTADITFARNEQTGKSVPLVPFDPEFPNAVRYSLLGVRDGVLYCTRDDGGSHMNHHANCQGVKDKPWRNKR